MTLTAKTGDPCGDTGTPENLHGGLQIVAVPRVSPLKCISNSGDMRGTMKVTPPLTQQSCCIKSIPQGACFRDREMYILRGCTPQNIHVLSFFRGGWWKATSSCLQLPFTIFYINLVSHQSHPFPQVLRLQLQRAHLEGILLGLPHGILMNHRAWVQVHQVSSMLLGEEGLQGFLRILGRRERNPTLNGKERLPANLYWVYLHISTDVQRRCIQNAP